MRAYNFDDEIAPVGASFFATYRRAGPTIGSKCDMGLEDAKNQARSGVYALTN